ncbi:MAG: GntR family transcriptional regulator [Chloroflexota bacterium]|nr:MAG: GntR family transcriptional regulator [Chloroflexota bacterium]
MGARRSNSGYDSDRLLAIVAINRERSTTTQDLALMTLRQAILDGTIEPGARLRQEDMAAVFDASRIPVREALRALEHEGLVSSEPHRGFTVSSLDADEVEEIYDLRAVLEGHAVRLAVPLLTERDLEDLERLFAEMRAASGPDEELARREAFYMRLFAVTARPRLVSLILRLRQDVSRSLRWKLVSHSPDHHQVFFEAIKRGDAEAAAEQLAIHYPKVVALLRRYLREGDGGHQ